MNFLRGTIIKIALPLILALSIFPGSIAQADGNSPPSASAVSLNTYGSLPVVVLNLTQSPINITVTTNSAFYSNYTFPLVAGLPGVYTATSGGSTAPLNNITRPASAVDGKTTFSLMPVAAVDAANNLSYNNNYGWMSVFNVFPSWTTPSNIQNTQYVILNGLSNEGAVATKYDAPHGYPTANGKNATAQGGSTTAYALNAAAKAKTSIVLGLNNGSTAAYSIDINSGGGAISGSLSPTDNYSILHAMHCALDVVTDCATIASGDVLGIVDYVAGLPATIGGIVNDFQNSTSSTNFTVATNQSYPTQAAGISVSASLPAGATNQTLVIQNGSDSQSLMYEVQAAANQSLPLLQQNAVFVTTWRQKPLNNSGEPLYDSSADTLFVTVLNEGIYASNQVQQYINSNNSSAQLTGGARYTPTKEQAQGTVKILEILNAIAKKNPQDVKAIIDMFGIHGKYGKIHNDPSALKSLNAELKTVLEKYKKDLPAVEQYLGKLAQK
jgi:hypothetical protein